MSVLDKTSTNSPGNQQIRKTLAGLHKNYITAIIDKASGNVAISLKDFMPHH